MKRDIRDLFKEDNRFKTLPKNHREEFLEKLQDQTKNKVRSLKWLKVAAVLLIALSIGIGITYHIPEETSVSPIVVQVEAIEAEYLKNIEKEWDNFVAIAEDETLINRFRNKLDKLNAEYEDISIQFKKDVNNILVIESLVENLQTRLQILKDIQEHIKILNQKTSPDENAI